MKKIFLENGHEKTINDLKDLPPMTSKLFDENIKTTSHKKATDHNGFGVPTLILSMFFVKFISKGFLRKKKILMLWRLCEDLKLIEDLYGVEDSEKYNYLFLMKQKEMKEKLRLINEVNLNLTKISWLEKFYIKKMMKKFYKKINPLIYQNDISGKKSRRFGHSAHFLYDIFGNNFKIYTGNIEKSLKK